MWSCVLCKNAKRPLLGTVKKQKKWCCCNTSVLKRQRRWLISETMTRSHLSFWVSKTRAWLVHSASLRDWYKWKMLTDWRVKDSSKKVLICPSSSSQAWLCKKPQTKVIVLVPYEAAELICLQNWSILTVDKTRPLQGKIMQSQSKPRVKRRN